MINQPIYFFRSILKSGVRKVEHEICFKVSEWYDIANVANEYYY